MPEGLPAASRPFFQPYDRVDLLSLSDLVSSRERPVLALAFGLAMSLVVLVLLNVGALAMARAQQQIRELALRRALGARARDLLRHALGEQTVLFGGGAAAGLLASPMLLAFVLDRMPPGLNLIKDVRLDWRVMTFAAIVSAAAALAVALLSVRVAVRHASVTPTLADTHGSAPNRVRIGRLLIAGQTAVAFALVLGGALFATSLVRLWSEDPGLRLGHAATFSVFYPDSQAGTTMDRWRQTNDLAGALRATPGVRGIALLDEQIMSNIITGQGFFEPPPSAIEDAPIPTSVRVSSTFFETAGIDLVAGRLPSDAELDTGAPVVAVSETVARAYWPEGTAIGRTLRRVDRPSTTVDCTVVGVVRDVRLEALDVPSTGVIFASWALPVRQTRGARVLVAMEDDAVLSTVVRRLGELEPGATVRNVLLLEEAAAETIRERRLAAAMASTFGGVALVFVALGVLGLVAMTSSRRSREMAIRLALGAEPGGVTRLLVGEQLRAVGLGLAAGGVLAAWFVPLLGSRLYGIGVYDASTWALTVAVIAATATVGTLVPAWRASRIDPAVALRGE
jgi:putative ABC transport system permease protein